MSGMELALNMDDCVVTSYRDHCQHITRGGTVLEVMAELMGKANGATHGLGGSMHMYRRSANFFGGNGIVGAQIPLGAGLAFAQKYLKRKAVAVTMCVGLFCLFGCLFCLFVFFCLASPLRTQNTRHLKQQQPPPTNQKKKTPNNKKKTKTKIGTATARPTRAKSTRRSTWRGCGTSPSSLCARTTTTAWARPSGAAPRAARSTRAATTSRA
jgi:hypothetical protein